MHTTEAETLRPSPARHVSKKFYEIAGRLLSLEVDAEWAARFADSYLDLLRLSPASPAAETRADLAFNISTAAPPPLPRGLETFAVPGGLCHADPRSYFLEVCGSRIDVAPREERRVTVWLGASEQARRRNALITVIAYALPAALRRCGLYDLHACGMVEPATGAGFVFPGASESGKTSLAVRLAASGWGFMSDDQLLVSDGPGGVEARGLRRPFQTSADALAGCALPRLEEALGVRVPNDPDKRMLDPEMLFPGRYAPQAPARVICFPVVTGERESRLREAGQADVMARLIKMCPWSSYDLSAAREHLALLGRLVKQCRAFRLDAGRDIFDDPRAAARLLAACV
ncbi:MAG TPA: hypothetical protein VER32_00945 [Pyrinomonadaceae bacterium]|nr:hypothetical protein [Pyrinomonadaceae bacterium]